MQTNDIHKLPHKYLEMLVRSTKLGLNKMTKRVKGPRSLVQSLFRYSVPPGSCGDFLMIAASQKSLKFQLKVGTFFNNIV